MACLNARFYNMKSIRRSGGEHVGAHDSMSCHVILIMITKIMMNIIKMIEMITIILFYTNTKDRTSGKYMD